MAAKKPYSDPAKFTPPAPPVTPELDLEGMIIRAPQHSDWPDAYYSDLLELCTAQSADTIARIADVEAEQRAAEEKQASIDRALLTYWHDVEARDRLIATMIANRPLWDRLPVLIDLLEKRRRKLEKHAIHLRQWAGWRARKAEQEAANAARIEADKQREAEEEAARNARWIAGLDPERRAEIEREQQAKAQRAQREAQRQAQREADRKAEAERVQTAREWVKGVLDGEG